MISGDETQERLVHPDELPAEFSPHIRVAIYAAAVVGLALIVAFIAWWWGR